ncbi:chemotaxis protein CheB [Alteromonas ponticola]|uniref:protein-glutamate methylesterase n=1 Tax=Alteromonas aquimaris TaxID=2998417 RepID=A0ABT3PAG1_9ALTE|nr:chemotaxis protein CheB [Alteromonas aquimaris]MCW8109767.1 chemotaxis protein CheB [Alteromonas aquimaris]
MANLEARYPADKPVFLVGASAGGVKALSYLASALPDDFPAPVFFLLHRRRQSKTKKGLFLKIIQSKSVLPVVVPNEGDVVKSGVIYMPRDDMHIGINDNRITFSAYPDDQEWRPSINFLFKAAAREYQDRAISVLLTGKLDDGVEGLKATTFHGGITIAQSPDDAYDPHLPLNALLNDHPVFVLPLQDMPKLFCELARHPFCKEQKQVWKESAEAAKRIKAALRM